MTDSDEVKLLPCPFCGGEAIDFQSQHDGLWVVCCDGCSARTGPQLINDLAAQRKAVIAAWNTRPPVVTDEVVERVARFADTLSVNRHYMTGQTCREVQNDLRALLASMPAVVSGLQSAGVPASPSGHSAEPEPSSTVSAVPVSVPNAEQWVFAGGEIPTGVRGSQIVWALGRYGDIYGPLPFDMFASEAWTGNMFYGSQDLIAWTPYIGELRDVVRYDASAIEARRAETQGGSVADESAVAKPDAHLGPSE